MTFERRRLELLDWFEQNLDVLAFRLDKDEVGVSVGSRTARSTVDRNGLVLSWSDPRVAVAQLQPVVEGIFRVFEPREAFIQHVRSAWTVPCKVDYQTATSAFGYATAFRPAALDWVTSDSSVLLDLDGTDSRAQVEYGIVTNVELATRLTDDAIGRISDSARPRLAGSSAELGLPEVAFYADLGWQDRRRSPILGAADLYERFEQILSQCSDLVDVLAQSVLSVVEEGSVGEFGSVRAAVGEE